MGISDGLTSRTTAERERCAFEPAVTAKHHELRPSRCLTAGQKCELDGADVLLPGLLATTVIADKGFDAETRVLQPLRHAGKVPVIPPRAKRLQPRTYDKELYKARHLIENFFANLKQFRAIATRYDKTKQNFLAAVHFAAVCIWLV